CTRDDEAAGEIDIDDPAEVVDAGFHGRPVHGYTGGVDDAGEIGDAGYRLLDLGLVGDAAGDAVFGRKTEFLAGMGERFLLEIDQENPPTALVEKPGGFQADAGGATRHEYGSCGFVSHYVLPHAPGNWPRFSSSSR